jgi:hypothetical protein
VGLLILFIAGIPNKLQIPDSCVSATLSLDWLRTSHHKKLLCYEVFHRVSGLVAFCERANELFVS